MSSLVSWLSVDSRRPSALYIATDSRITWGGPTAAKPTGKVVSWDVGRKVFAARTSPEIFGFVGDAFFATQVLTQLINRIDERSVSVTGLIVEQRIAEIAQLITATHSAYPKHLQTTSAIYYGCREGTQKSSAFYLVEFAWSAGTDVETSFHPLPPSSAVIVKDGTGKGSIANRIFQWNKTEAGGTSRAVFSAFCDAISSGDDWRTGGAPQLAAITPFRNTLQIGTINNNDLYLNGVIVANPRNFPRVEWRNQLFERCSPYTKFPVAKAQRQARPRSL